MKTTTGTSHVRPSARPARLWIALALSCAGAAAFGGCGRNLPELVDVRGRVTFGGGDWPAPGTLYFTPAEPAEGLPARPATADFDTDGRFVVKSFEDGEGLVPGRYLVGVECWEVPPNMDGIPARSYLDAKHQSPQTSGLEISIQPGQGSQTLELDVPRPDRPG